MFLKILNQIIYCHQFDGEKRLKMEFIIRTDLTKELPEVIDFNFDELKKELKTGLGKYQNLLVTEDSIKSAKGDKATLNKLRTAIEDRRKEVKKACLLPYNAFEIKVKEIVGMIDEPIIAIDSQIKKFDEIKADEKLKEIFEIYETNIGVLKAVIPFEKLNNPRWLNATYLIKDIQKELITQISQINKDLVVIDTLDLAYRAMIKDKYLQCLELSTALAEKSRLEEQQKALGEIEAEQKQSKEIVEEVAEEVAEINTEEALEEINFKVWVTQKQKSDLKKFLIENNIKIGRSE